MMAKKHGRAAAGAASNAEFAVAAAVLVLLEAALLINYLALPQKRLADEASGELSAALATLEMVESSKANAQQRESRYADLLSMAKDGERSLPPELRNEDIARDIGAYAASHNITVSSVAFAGRTLTSPEEYAAAGGGTAAGVAAAAGDGTAAGAGPADGSGLPAGDGQPAGAAAADAGPAAGAAAAGAARGGVVSLQDVQVDFTSEFHTLNAFLGKFEGGGQNARIKSLALARVQEGVVKGALSLEYVALSMEMPGGGRQGGGLGSGGLQGGGPQPDDAASPPSGGKASLFEKYDGYIEEGIDPTILLISSEDDVDPDFYIILNDSASNDTKVTFGVFPRTETEVYFNANNAVRAKLRISGDAGQFEYTYTLGSAAPRTEKRKLSAADGRLRVDVVSRPRSGENDKVAILLDVENETSLPLDVRVRNDDVLDPRFHLGETKGEVAAKR